MFYATFETLCKANKTSPSAVCIEIELSKTTASYWKRSENIPKRETLEKIAQRFGVTVDYLLGRETQNAPANQGESEFIESIAIKADAKTWNDLLNRLSRENKIKLFEHAQLLLQVQDLTDQGGR